MPESSFSHFVWRSDERSRYRTFDIPKKAGGQRRIAAPTRRLRTLQLKVAYLLDTVYSPHPYAYAYIRGGDRTIVSHAQRHCKQRLVLNFDLKDFFPTITFQRIRGMLLGKPFSFPERVATALAHIACFKGSLPIGSPCSPVISNMICRRLDRDLSALARNNQCRYSRYADDITFSTRRTRFPSEIYTSSGEDSHLGIEVTRLVVSNGFAINEPKTRIRSSDQRQEVTGLTVNRRPNVRPKFVSKIRAMLHAWRIYGLVNAEIEFCEKYDERRRSPAQGKLFRRVVEGHLGYLCAVRGTQDRQYLKFRSEYELLTGKVKSTPMIHSPKKDFDVFIAHASEDKALVVRPIVKALEEAGIKVWLDESEIGWGDSILRLVQDGLKKSTFAVAVISQHSLGKEWPEKEWSTLLSMEIADGVTRVLPLIVEDASADGDTIQNRFRKVWPLLAEKRYELWNPADIGSIVSALKAKLDRISGD